MNRETNSMLVLIEDRGSRALYRCDCGNLVEYRKRDINSKPIISCGCFRRKKLKEGVNKRHGFYNIPEYSIWKGMVFRCRENSPGRKYYFSKGIIVCDRWAKDFLAFMEDMGPRPSKKHSIERINNDGNYEPGNCKWALPDEQSCNKRNTFLVEYDGKLRSLVQVCKEFGITDHGYVRDRVKYGWPLKKALETPKRNS